MFDSSRLDPSARHPIEPPKVGPQEKRDKRRARRYSSPIISKKDSITSDKSHRSSLPIKLESSPDRIPEYQGNLEASQRSSVDHLVEAADQDPDLGDTTAVKTAETAKKFTDRALVKGSTRLLAGIASVPVLFLSKATALTFSLATGGIAGLTIPVMTLWNIGKSIMTESKEAKIKKLSDEILSLKDEKKKAKDLINKDAASLANIEENINNLSKSTQLEEEDKEAAKESLLDKQEKIKAKILRTKDQLTAIKGQIKLVKVEKEQAELPESTELSAVKSKRNWTSHKGRILNFRHAAMAGSGPISALGESLLAHALGKKDEEEKETIKKFNGKADDFFSWAGTGLGIGVGTAVSGSAITVTTATATAVGVVGGAVIGTAIAAGAIIAAIGGGMR